LEVEPRRRELRLNNVIRMKASSDRISIKRPETLYENIVRW
jgi:hypothetical protein